MARSMFLNSRFRTFPLLTLFPLLAFPFHGCSKDDESTGKEDSGTPADRFALAEDLTEQWCATSQLLIAGLEGSDYGIAHIEQAAMYAKSDLANAHAAVDPNSDTPIKVAAYIDKMSNTSLAQAPSSLTKEVSCKFKSHDGLEQSLSETIPGQEGTCKALNQKALDWALEQLTPQEKARYDAAGKKLAFSDDILHEAGIAWYDGCSEFTSGATTYTLAASSLLVIYADHPNLEEDLKGVHYCKLLPPSQMLYWVIERAFWDDPVSSGPNDESNGALLCTDDEPSDGGPQDCRLEGPNSPGSCIFLFSASSQHYCEEYTGTDWTQETAREKCASRTDGAFSTSLCEGRTDETSVIDGDGVYKGLCVMNCGQSGEYYWRVYSESDGVDIEQYCSDWFPV